MNSRNVLFANADIFSVIQHRTAAVKQKVQDIPSEKLLNASETDLVQALVTEFWLEVPVLAEEGYIADSSEAQVDVSRDPMRMVLDRSRPFLIAGNKTVIAIPFTGNPEFFSIRPQTYSLGGIRADVGKGELLLTYTSASPNGDAIRRGYEQTSKTIRDHLSSLRDSANQFNNQLETLVRSQIKARKDRLLADAQMTAAIGLPMKRREGMPVTFAVPVTRRAPRIEQIKVSGPFKPEPALATEDYDEILRILKNMVRVMELSPHAFATMGEEDLRSHFLVHLNGTYEGQATGETFNFQGKTDILIRVDGKNVFIAECKIWRGEKVFLETIDQLLSYLSWRDTKAAVLIFNRNAGFTGVLDTIAKATPNHACFKKDLGRLDESTFRYVFGQPNDENRELILTVLAFDIPSGERSQSQRK